MLKISKTDLLEALTARIHEIKDDTRKTTELERFIKMRNELHKSDSVELVLSGEEGYLESLDANNNNPAYVALLKGGVCND